MRSDILQVLTEYRDGKLSKMTVLVQFSKGDVRAICATTKMPVGYIDIPANATISDALIDRVVDFGLELLDRDEIFPGWEEKLQQQST